MFQASFDPLFTGICSRTAQYEDGEWGQWMPMTTGICKIIREPPQSCFHLYKATPPLLKLRFVLK